MDDCEDKIRLTLSDRNGLLRFESFEIIDAPQCRRLTEELREYLLGRPLVQADPDRIRRMNCPESRVCVDTVARLIEEYQQAFGTAADG